MGGEARVTSARITPNEAWTEVVRNQVFKELVTCTEAALERLLVRRLSEGDRDDAWRAWAGVAVRWKSGKAGVGALVPSLELFQSVDGKGVTVGTVLAEHSRARAVAVAATRRSRQPTPTLVLATTGETTALLDTLKVKTEDVTEHLREGARAERGAARAAPGAARLARRGAAAAEGVDDGADPRAGAGLR